MFQLASLQSRIAQDDVVPAVLSQLVEVPRVYLPALKLLIQLLQKGNMMLERFLPFEATVFHVTEDVIFTHPPGGDLKILGAAALVEVPVDDFEDADEGDEDEGLYAHYGELVAPVHDLLQGRHICDRDQEVGAYDVRESHSEHGPVVPLLQVFIDRGELGPAIEVASKTPQQLVVVV